MNILDRFKSGSADLWDLVSHYSSGGDVRELLELAKSDTGRISAIFVLAELYEAADAVWKDVVKYASDPELHTAYGVLRIVHERVKDESNFAEIMQAISIANLNEDVIFAKVVAIVNSVGNAGLRSMLDYSITNRDLGYHAAGLLLLINHHVYDEGDLESIYSLGNRTLNIYVCSVVSRYHEGKNIEKILPELVRKNLYLIRKSRRPRSR